MSACCSLTGGIITYKHSYFLYKIMKGNEFVSVRTAGLIWFSITVRRLIGSGKCHSYFGVGNLLPSKSNGP